MSEKINGQDLLIKDMISRLSIELPEGKLENDEGQWF